MTTHRLPRSACSPILIVGLSLWMGLGCGNPNSSTTNGTDSGQGPSAIPIRLLVVDDDAMADTIDRLWNARSETKVVVERISSSELGERPRLGADAVIYPSGYLGTLVERKLIEPFSAEVLQSDELGLREVFELVRLREVRWGRQVYAVPFGSPQLTIAYRKDVLDALGLSPPSSWAEYHALVEKLSNRDRLSDFVSPDGEWVAATEPLGAGWAGQVLVARAAAYARHPSQYSVMFDYATMEPLIGSPPFVRALTELVEISTSDPPAFEMSPGDAYARLLEGQTAMALVWPTRVVGAPTVPLGFAELPGSADVFNLDRQQWEVRSARDERQVPVLATSGRLGSITGEARRFRDAANLLILLSGGAWSADISPSSTATTLYRKSHARKVGSWISPPVEAAAAQQYYELVERTQNRAAYIFSIRIPGRAQYLAALDAAVHSAVRGERTPEAALVECAEQWRAITESLGVEAQKQAYSNSLGL